MTIISAAHSFTGTDRILFFIQTVSHILSSSVCSDINTFQVETPNTAEPTVPPGHGNFALIGPFITIQDIFVDVEKPG